MRKKAIKKKEEASEIIEQICPFPTLYVSKGLFHKPTM